MPRTPFAPFTSTFVVLAAENIDTDQIIPARFLTTIERSGLGEHAFQDWRYLPDGRPNPRFVLNDPGAAGARVLVAGRNFGCGSSREHAVWALLGAGFDAVVSTAFADIFRSNALGNGLLPVQVEPTALHALMSAAAGARVSIDLASQVLTLPDGNAASFPVPTFAKHCLLHGIDEMEFLLGASAEIDDYEAVHPPRVATW
jgi:3-isopropylmalate/(R)-2-methylmalate dehydratase small subunit